MVKFKKKGDIMKRRLILIDYSKPVRIDLGCGEKKKEGFIGLDARDCGQEIVWDVRGGLPFPDSSVDEMYSCHFLEHLSGEDLICVIREIWRVLKSGCEIFIRVPHSHCDTAFYPMHKSFWNERMLKAMIEDPVQKGDYEFEILQNRKVGEELQVRLRKVEE